jgi:hypothetical protein
LTLPLGLKYEYGNDIDLDLHYRLDYVLASLIVATFLVYFGFWICLRDKRYLYEEEDHPEQVSSYIPLLEALL